jgi:hypothetical protein
LRHRDGHTVACDRQPCANRDLHARSAPAADDGRRAVVLVPEQRREACAELPRQFVRDSREDLPGRSASGRCLTSSLTAGRCRSRSPSPPPCSPRSPRTPASPAPPRAATTVPPGTARAVPEFAAARGCFGGPSGTAGSTACAGDDQPGLCEGDALGRRPRRAAFIGPAPRPRARCRATGSALVFRSFPGAALVRGARRHAGGEWLVDLGAGRGQHRPLVHVLVRVIRRCLPAPPHRARWPVCLRWSGPSPPCSVSRWRHAESAAPAAAPLATTTRRRRPLDKVDGLVGGGTSFEMNLLTCGPPGGARW